MLGSRFDLAEAMVEIAQRDVSSAAPCEASTASPAAEMMLGDHCEELERQMVEVARMLHSGHPRTGVWCPICDSRMRLKAGRPMATAAALGVEQHGLECETCGLTTERAYDAAHGYQDLRR